MQVTVGELIAKLRQFDPSTPVASDCCTTDALHPLETGQYEGVIYGAPQLVATERGTYVILFTDRNYVSRSYPEDETDD